MVKGLVMGGHGAVGKGLVMAGAMVQWLKV